MNIIKGNLDFLYICRPRRVGRVIPTPILKSTTREHLSPPPSLWEKNSGTQGPEWGNIRGDPHWIGIFDIPPIAMMSIVTHKVCTFTRHHGHGAASFALDPSNHHHYHFHSTTSHTLISSSSM